MATAVQGTLNSSALAKIMLSAPQMSTVCGETGLHGVVAHVIVMEGSGRATEKF